MVPGDQRDDARDIYTVMQKIWAEIGPKMQVTSFNLTGYSLGGTNAAFVALLDEENKVFNFKKVLLLNPSVQLYNSISKLDRFLENIPGRRRQLQQDVQTASSIRSARSTRNPRRCRFRRTSCSKRSKKIRRVTKNWRR